MVINIKTHKNHTATETKESRDEQEPNNMNILNRNITSKIQINYIYFNLFYCHIEIKYFQSFKNC